VQPYLNIIRSLTKPEDTETDDLSAPQLVSDMDLVHNDPEASNSPEPVYVGDPEANTVPARVDNIAVYGRKRQR
jgi:hypothetical protein